ncbi:nuclear transport factor 2 family protein [Kitasatospora sp. NPDC088391]|uniref:nuclear transport factor 2 family protein n=1 Tax=Kitasatospora sp. NPDC088391 TaxID=3364074 RepID=UPI00381417DB
MQPPWEEESEIRALLDRYLIGLDDDKIDDDWMRALFTEDARVAFPISGHRGIDGMVEWHRASLDKFAAHQHLGSSAVLERSGPDRAVLRANVIASHVHHPGTEGDPMFQAGTLATALAVRTGAGWRLAALEFKVLWTRGAPAGRPS